jgi:hypothetical protein
VCRINSLNETILLAFQTNEEQIARDYFEENEQWTLKDTKSESGVRLGATNLVFTVLLTRKPTYFVINVVLPILILSLITLAVFWLPADSGEKVGLSVTIVLAFSVMQLVVADLIPRTSDTVPILGVRVFIVFDSIVYKLQSRAVCAVQSFAMYVITCCVLSSRVRICRHTAVSTVADRINCNCQLEPEQRV